MMARAYAAGAATVAVLAAGAVPIVSAVAAPSPDPRLAPCRTEDQTTACVWDARQAGNGTGRSFLVTSAGRVVFLPHYAAHALLSGGAR